MNSRIIDDNIQHVPEGHIFVFGSNQSGRHGKGAAKTAMKFGAVYGQAEGLQGRAYAIPTVDHRVRNTLSLSKIAVYVNRFVEFVYKHPELTFLVTEIGCGLAGLKIKQIAPLFKECESMENVHLPEKFWHKIKDINNG